MILNLMMRQHETKNGVQNGYMRIYSRDGKLEKEVYYKEGTQIKI